MSKRVTIMIDNDLDKKLKKIQASRKAKEDGHVSYSKVINDCIRKTMK